MEKEEALYAAVGDEISRGQIRKGLWAKALADEGYDERKAKAKYIKLRVKSLREEVALAAAADRGRNQEEQERQKIQAIESEYQDIHYRTTSLAGLRRTRRLIQILGFWGAFFAAAILSFPHVATDQAERTFLAIGLGIIVGLVSLLITELVRRLMPSQRYLEREEAAIKKLHTALERQKMSWVGRLASDVWNILLVLAVLVYLAAQAVRYLTE